MRRLPIDVVHKLESVAIGIFAPIFFAVAGLKVDIPSLLTPQLLLIALLVLGVAVFGKMVGAYLGGRLVGLDHARSFAYGSALNARGAVEIIIGLSLGILSQDMYSIIVLMAVTTSLMAPALLCRALRDVVPDEEEAKRLRREELARGSLLAKTNRVLLPMRQRQGAGRFDIQKIETHLIGKLGQGVAVTLLNVTPPGARAQRMGYLGEMSGLFATKELSKKVVESTAPVDAILDKAHKDYDLIIVGAPEKASGRDVLFNPLTDQIVRLAPCPTMIVKGTRVAEHWPPKRILVPTSGSVSARYATEVAFAVAHGEEARVTLLSVVESEKRGDYRFDSSESARARQLGNAHEIVASLR